MKTGFDIVRCLSETKELCKTCYNWCTQEMVGPNDLPQCSEGHKPNARNYLLGGCATCSEYCNM